MNEKRGEKAPSTRKCIKTNTITIVDHAPVVRKHPAPEGALRLDVSHPVHELNPWSESTQHQKVH